MCISVRQFLHDVKVFEIYGKIVISPPHVSCTMFDNMDLVCWSITCLYADNIYFENIIIKLWFFLTVSNGYQIAAILYSRHTYNWNGFDIMVSVCKGVHVVYKEILCLIGSKRFDVS